MVGSHLRGGQVCGAGRRRSSSAPPPLTEPSGSGILGGPVMGSGTDSDVFVDSSVNSSFRRYGESETEVCDKVKVESRGDVFGAEEVKKFDDKGRELVD